MKGKKIAVILLALIMVLTLLAGCGSGDSDSGKTDSGEAEDPIILGWIGPLTGDNMIWGTAEMQSLTMLIDEANENGGILGRQIEFKTYDNRADAVETTNAAKKAIQQDGCVAIFGCNASTAAIALAEVCNENGIPQIASQATNSKVTQKDDGTVRPYTFRVCLSDPQQGDVMANYAYKELGIETVAILYEIGSDYSLGITQNFTESFTNAGGNVVVTEAYNTGDVDFRAQLTKIAGYEFDALFIPANYKEVGLIANQARSMGITQQLLGPDAWQVDDLFTLAAEAIEGGYFVSSTDITSDALKSFSSQFESVYGYVPSEVGTNAYIAADQFYLLKNAIETAGSTDPEAIRDALEGSVDVQCLTSKITVMPESHNPIRSATIFHIENSQFVSITDYIID